jgi:putative Mg2+ transporter-C (MgtC) family protein
METYLTDIGSQLRVVLEVALAAVLGGLIGVEREIADKPAGFRTLMLVAGASALLMNLGEILLGWFGPSGMPGSPDPTRVIQAIVTGISFLGAGTIIRRAREERVEGLTTAAAILFAAAVGISVAVHRLVLAVGVTLLALIVLIGMRSVERWLTPIKENRHHRGDETSQPGRKE